MKAIGLPPSDPRVRQMNDAQWLWCYFNEMQDQKDEADAWKSRLDYLTYFINYEMAKSVHETEGARKDSKYQQEGLHKNTVFEKEMKAATLGYTPESGLTVDEFLEQHENKKTTPDLMNDSFEDLLASGGFVEVADAELGIGNKNESLDSFLDRAFAMQEQLIEKQQYKEDIPIGIDEQDWEDLNNPANNRSHEEILQEDIDNLDLDIFDVD